MTGRTGLAASRAVAVPDAITVPPPTSLEQAACYRYCEALVRARHYNYPVASVFARSQLRKHILAVFAFVRVADDFADEAVYHGRRAYEIDRWEEHLHAAYHGRPDHPVFVALADTVEKFALPITEFTALLSGFRTDLERRSYATFHELRSYTRQAAEPIGRLLLYIAGYRAPRLLAYADDMSTAVAVARLLQNVSANWSRGRVYLPAEDLWHFGVTEADIAARRVTPEIGALARYEVARARALFERARPLVDAAELDLAVELALTWHGGMRILDKIAAQGARLFAGSPQLDNTDRALVLARSVMWRGRLLPGRARYVISRLLERRGLRHDDGDRTPPNDTHSHPE